MLLFFKISSCGSRKSILKKNLGSRSVVAAVVTRKFEQINFKNKKAIDENRSNNAQSRTWWNIRKNTKNKKNQKWKHVTKKRTHKIKLQHLLQLEM